MPITPAQPSTPAITVESIMIADVHCLTPTTTVRDAIGLLLDKKISGAPVVDSKRSLMTVVSEGDLMKLAATQGLQKEIGMCLEHLPKTDDLIIAQKNDAFSAIYRLFLQHRVHRILVVDGNGRLQGLVSRSNVLRLLYDPTSEPKSAGA